MDEYEEIKALELELTEPSVRKNSGRLNELISDNFEEFGSSGVIYRKRDVLKILPRSEHVSYVLSDFTFTRLGKDYILIKYNSRSLEKNTLRASIWVKHNGNWQILHHQATVVPNTI